MRALFSLIAAASIPLALGCSDPHGAAPPAELTFAPSPPVMPRLTSLQYRNTLKDVFGGVLPSTALEPDTNPYLFYSIGAASTTLSELGTQQYADAASAITDALFGDAGRRQALLGCVPAGSEDPCVKEFLKRTGRRLFRRPQSDADVERWLNVVRSTAEGDVNRGIRMALYGMLQAPRFLYRIEVGEPDPSDHSMPQRRRYDSFEMAERLSFLLWNSTPDEELLAAAERGELLDPDSLRTQALRLLEAPQARPTVQSFFDQYFNLSVLARLDRDPARYPAFSNTLGPAMRTEIQLLVDDFVFRRNSDIRELFSTHRTFVNTELAALYQVPAPGASEIAFVPVELPPDGARAGLLTLGAFLTMNAHPTQTSPTLRGKYILERVLCQLVPPPPGNVNLNLDDMSGNPRTLRERLEEHRKNPACYGCHSVMDPPGFLFEGFDSIGVHRTLENNQPVNTSSDIDGKSYADGRDLGAQLATDPRVPSCMVKQVYRQANGRLDQPGDEAALDALTRRFAQSGYRFRELLVALVQSEGFRTVADSAESGEVMP